MKLSTWTKPLLCAATIGAALTGGAQSTVPVSNGSETIVAGERYPVGGTIISSPLSTSTRQPLIRHSMPDNVRFYLDGAIETHPDGLVDEVGDEFIIAGIRHEMQGTIESEGFIQRRVESILDRVNLPDDLAEAIATDELRRQSYLQDILSATNRLLARIDTSVNANFQARRASFVTREVGERTTMRLTVVPKASLQLTQRDLSLSGSYQLAYGKEFGERGNTYQSHAAQFSLDRDVFTRSSISFGVNYAYADDEPDLTNPGPALERQQSSIRFGFSRGRSDDRLNLGVDATWSGNSFSGYLSDFGGQNRSMSARAGYQLGPRLNLSLATNLNTSSYQDEEVDSAAQGYQLGVNYLYSSRLNVNFGLGVTRKQLDLTGQSSTGLAWNGNVFWRPRRNTSFNLTTSRRFVETYEFSGENLADTLIQSQELAISWKQTWNSRFSTFMAARTVSTPSGSSQDFLRNSFSFGGSYNVSKQLHVGVRGAVESVELDGGKGSSASFGLSLSLDL